MLGALTDHLLYRGSAARRRAAARAWPVQMRIVDTALGPIRVHDGGGRGPALVLAPDGPCVIEHYARLIELLSPDFRVVVFDLPGFGHSVPTASYGHRLDQGAAATLAVLDALAIERATLAFSCVNGFYAIAAAALAPRRIEHLVLSQTPGIVAMQAWTQRMIPAPLRIPGLGQLINFAGRRKLAAIWLGTALPRGSDRAPYDEIAQAALDDGGCYCLAGVVQGMLPTSEDDRLLRLADTPVTLLWGGADRSHRHTQPESLRTHLPQARILRYDRIGHFPDLEQPEIYAAVVRDALLAKTAHTA